MSAEKLRKAAALMRERATSATPGPWGVDEPWQDVFAVTHAADREVEVATPSTFTGDGGMNRPNAEHVASWHPAVALAVADWLESCAANYDRLHGHEEHHALAVATAYLGETP